MTKGFFSAIAALWLCVGAASADPFAFVRSVSGALDQAAGAAKAQGPAAGRAAVEAVLKRDFDLQAMGAAALPQEFRGMTTQRYFAAYRGYLAQVFVGETLKAGEGELVILGQRKNGALVLVGSRVDAEGARGRIVEWYLAPRGASYKVVNASVDSVLITQQNRREFSDPLAAGGMDALLSYLQKAGR